MTISHKKAFKYLQNYLDNKISPKADLLLKEHLETCESCKNIFDLHKTLADSNPWKNEGSSPARINQTIELIQKDQRSFLMFSKLSKSVKFLSVVTIAVALIALVSVSINNLLPSPGNEPASIRSNETPTGDSTAIPEQPVLTEDSAVEFSELNTVGGYIRAMDIENSLMLVGISHKFMLVDIQDPLEPKTLGSLRLDSWISAVAIKLPYAYIALGDGTVVLLNISNPSSPSIHAMISNFYDLDNGYFSKIILHNTDTDTNAYLIWNPLPNPDGPPADHVRIVVLDAEDLTQQISFEFPLNDLPDFDLNIYGDYLLFSRGCASYRSCSQNSEIEMSQLPGFNPEKGAVFSAGVKGSPGNTAIYEDLLLTSWVECNARGCVTHFIIHDINKPDQAPVFTLELNGTIRGLAINEGIAVLSYADGLHRVDLNDSENIVDLGFQTKHVYTSGELQFSNDFLYLKSASDGIHIYDFSADNTPVYINSLFEGGVFADIEVFADIVFSLSRLKKLEVLDFSDPTDPVKLGEINAGEGRSVASVFVNKQTAYVTSYNCLTISVVSGCTGTLELFDVSILENPRKLGLISIAREVNTTWKVVATDSHAYMIDGETLWIIDVSDPLNIPEPENFYVGGVQPTLIMFVGENRLLLGGGNGMRLYDISSPTKPKMLKAAGTRPADEVVIFQSKDVAYLAGRLSGYPFSNEQKINLLDLDTFVFTPVSFGKDVGTVNAMSTYREYLLVVDDNYLYIFQIDDPANPVQINKYPVDITALDMTVHGQFIYLRGNAGSLTILEIDE